MMEKGYVFNKIKAVQKSIKTIDEIVATERPLNVILDDIEGLTRTFKGAFEYILKQYLALPVASLEGDIEPDNMIIYHTDYNYTLLLEIINLMNLIDDEKEYSRKLKYIKRLERKINGLEYSFREIFLMIDML
jgi:hypothetical protein